ncbi:DUF1398 domain-containing protein [Planctomicrobium piriforme]|uniref:Uncharacterized conserved protein YbcV, DUF1398 family n=1 Tax=Planctomicrobium piriforme TaxID=1576369 RepID=A0A1I3IGN8_9PLAN|nr:DUF1398 family protein [Planctomicrobium piriforme]SFI46997.1 Uncharacterized conserved protein YbcV, DUF1398 family [Planctomicrobium piriforme]
MQIESATVMLDCTRAALTGEMNFPDIVGRLSEIGVERYHADYSRQEITYYLQNGDSLVVPSPHAESPTGDDFDAKAVASAVRQSQQGEHTYPDFVRKTRAAGCVGYFVQITGRKAIYFGRNGDTHIELFPQR